MKKYLLILLALLFPAAIRAQDFVRIDHVGLGTAEFYGSNLPTEVRVHIPALPLAQTLQLQFQFETADSDKDPLTLEPHRISKQVPIAAGVPMDFELALPLPSNNRAVMIMAVIDSTGRQIGQARRELNARGLTSQNLAIILCPDKKICDNAWSQIRSSADADERVNKTRTRMIETVPEPLNHWWEYGIADAVVVAGPVLQMTTNQRDALENYARHGGTLILLEKEVTDASFLTVYRQRAISPVPIPVGRGKLIRLPSLDSKALGSAIKWGISPENVAEYTKWFLKTRADQDYFIGRVGITFTFPRLRWMIIWLSAFILIVGPVNFILLHRLGRLEWGWGTTCAISFLFAAGLFFANSARRPKDFMLDDTAIYWMDSQSPRAFGEYAFRVYAPERGPVLLSLGRDGMVSKPNWNQTFGDSGAEIGTGMNGKKETLSGWQMQLGPPPEIAFPMFRWSYQDFYAQGNRDFSGTVHVTPAKQLKNDTGQIFRQALFLDFKANQQFLIPQLMPGKEIDLTAIHPVEIYNPDEIKDLQERVQQLLEQRRQAATVKPFTIAEIPYANLDFVKEGRVFVGWIDSQSSNAKLDVPFINRQGGALVFVTLEKQ